MKSLFDFQNEIETVNFSWLFKGRKELEGLNELMIEGEFLEAIIAADFSNNQGLLVLSSKNIFFASEVNGEMKRGTIPIEGIVDILIEGDVIIIEKENGTLISIHSTEDYEAHSYFVEKLTEKTTKTEEIQRPDLSNRKKSHNKQIVITICSIISFYLFLGVLISFLETTPETRTISNSKYIPQTNSITNKPNLDVSLEEFNYNFKNYSLQYEMPMAFSEFEIDKMDNHGSYDKTYMGCIERYVCAMGGLNSENEVLDMVLLGGGAKTPEESAKLLLSYPIAIRALDSSITEEEAATILKSLEFTHAIANYEEFEKEIYHKGVKYHFILGAIGVMLIIEKEK